MDKTKKALVTTTDTDVKEVNTDMGKKPNVVKKSITPLIAKQIDTVNKTDKSQASNKKLDTSSRKNTTKVNNWINQGLFKQLTQKTQLTK